MNGWRRRGGTSIQAIELTFDASTVDRAFDEKRGGAMVGDDSVHVCCHTEVESNSISFEKLK